MNLLGIVRARAARIELRRATQTECECHAYWRCSLHWFGTILRAAGVSVPMYPGAKLDLDAFHRRESFACHGLNACLALVGKYPKKDKRDPGDEEGNERP